MASETVELILKAKDLATGVINSLRSGMEKLNNASMQYKATVDRLSGSANEFKNTVVKLAATVGAAGLARSFIEINASAEKTKYMLKGLMGSVESANEAFDWLLEVSTRAPFSIGAMKDAFVKLQVAGLDPMKGSLETLMDAIAQFGGSDQDLEMAAVAIQQMAGKGVISMEELRQQIGERVPTAIKAMAEGLGMSMAELSKAIEKGSISATQGLNAMMSKFKEWYGGTGAQMMNSWVGIISNVKVAWEKFMLSLGEMGVFDRLKTVINGFLKKIDEMKATGELKTWGDRIASVVNTVISVITTLAGVIGKLLDTFGPFLPAIAQAIIYFKTLKIAILGPIGIIGNLIAKIFELSTALKSLTVGANLAGIALRGALVVGTAAAIAAIASLIYYVIWGRKEIDDYEKTMERISKTQEQNARIITNLQALYSNLGIKQGDINEMIKEFHKLVDEGVIVFNKLTGQWERAPKSAEEVEKAVKKAAAAVKEGSRQWIEIEEKRIKSIKALYDYETAAAEQNYKDGKISLQQYLKTRERLQKDYVNRLVKLKEMELEIEKKAENPDIVKIRAIQEEILQIKTQAAAEQLKVQSDLTEGLKREHEKEFDNWKTLQELKLQSLQAQMDLQNTIEETAVKNGLMRQSELLENQLSRLRQFYEEKIRIAEETMQKIAEIEGTESESYIKAAAEREQIQTELAAKIIASEQQISEAKIKEEEEAQKWISQYVDNRIKLAEIERDRKLEILREYYEQSLIEEQQYEEARAKIEDEYNQKIEESNKDAAEKTKIAWTTTYKDAADFAAAMLEWMYYVAQVYGADTAAGIEMWREKLRNAYKDVITTAQSAIGSLRSAYDEVKQIGITSLSSATELMKNIVYLAKYSVENLHSYMKDLGKTTMETVGMTAKEWISRVADYINYVKGLMASLQDYIQGLRMQLVQLRGDRMAELEMWYEQEKKKLEEKYKDELGMTQEYYEALRLLQEVYNEKKKKLLEEEAKMEMEYKSSEKTKNKTEGGAAGIAPVGNFAEYSKNQAERLKQAVSEHLSIELCKVPQPKAEVEIKKDLTLELVFKISTYDPETTDRYIKDVFFPRFERYLKLKGVTLT